MSTGYSHATKQSSPTSCCRGAGQKAHWGAASSWTVAKSNSKHPDKGKSPEFQYESARKEFPEEVWLWLSLQGLENTLKGKIKSLIYTYWVITDGLKTIKIVQIKE